MKELRYSPDAIEKLQIIKEEITCKYSLEIAKNKVKKMIASFHDLQQFEKKGLSAEKVIGVPCDYRILYIEHNYVFYRIGKNAIYIVDIYNEKEDFMWKLFGINTTPLETENYGNE